MMLCLALRKTRQELLSSMSSSELTDWISYWQIHPFGEYQSNSQINTPKNQIKAFKASLQHLVKRK